MPPSDGYVSLLLRFRRVHHVDQARWIVSTQCAQSGERHWFANVDELVAFLHEEFGGSQNSERPLANRESAEQ